MCKINIIKILTDVAIKWSEHILASHEGKPLEVGLKISASIMDYVNLLKNEDRRKMGI